MAKVIRITDVPDDVHAALSAQAQDAGRSLSDHLRDQLGQIVAGPVVTAPAAKPARSNGPENAADVVARLRGTLVNSKR